MRLSIVLLFFGSLAVAQVPTFDQLAEGRVEGTRLLGYSQDGARVAWLESYVEDGSGFLRVDAVEQPSDGGAALASFRIHGEHEPGTRAVKRRRADWDAFVARLDGDGVALDHATAWRKDHGAFVSPDGARRLAWHAGRERSAGSASNGESDGRAYAATLEDHGDRAVLFELFSGYAPDGVTRHAPPELLAVYSASDGDHFFVLTRAFGKQMCWDATDWYAQPFSLKAIRGKKPARDANQAGMVAYAAGDYGKAQASFRAALAIDPGSARAQFNLAAVSARLGQDAVAIAALKKLSAPSLVAWKVLTDPDFTAARARAPLRRYLEKLGYVPPELPPDGGSPD